MKRITLFLGLMAVFCTGVKAQDKMELRYGLFAGMNFSNMNLDDAFAFEGTLWSHDINDVEKKMHCCLRLGGVFEMKFNKSLGLQAELFYNQTGFVQKYKYTDTAGEWDCKAKTSVHALSVGVMLKAWPVKWMSVDLGVQPNINLSVVKKSDKTVGNLEKHEVFSYLDDGYNTFSFDALAGLTFYPWRKLFVQTRYNFGLTDVLKADTPHYVYVDPSHTILSHSFTDAKSKNRTFQVSVGFFF
ncbi:MAG: PorT family protein [Bacteroidales bacterium]|nr:PorT family protein [Bacteroidales bacterium]